MICGVNLLRLRAARDVMAEYLSSTRLNRPTLIAKSGVVFSETIAAKVRTAAYAGTCIGSKRGGMAEGIRIRPTHRKGGSSPGNRL